MILQETINTSPKKANHLHSQNIGDYKQNHSHLILKLRRRLFALLIIYEFVSLTLNCRLIILKHIEGMVPGRILQNMCTTHGR